MPNRILKESVCSSENVDGLTWFQEVFFYRLIVNCDDFGRMDARPKILASKLFPLKDIRMNQITEALRALTSAELVVIYEKDGHPFIQMKTWDRHQSIRAKRSKFPSPDEDCNQLNADEINCKQMKSNESKCSRNPIQSVSISVSNSVSNARTREETATDTNFNTFWDAYPRHEDKKNAKKAFDKLKPDADMLRVMLTSIDRWKQSDQWQENNGQFIPYPATWLNGERWKDEVPVKHEQKPAKTVTAQQYEQRDYSSVQDYYSAQQDREMEEFMRRQSHGI